MSTKTITVFAEKGGVGKTSITLTLATYFADLGKRVLCIDLDKQGNLTQFFLGSSRYHQMFEEESVSALLNPKLDPEPNEIVFGTDVENVSLIPASPHMKKHLIPEKEWGESEFEIKDFLDDLEGNFDYVFCDTPPAIDTLQTWTALLAANYAVSPVEPEAYSSQSLHGGDLRLTAARQQNARLVFLGYVVNLKKSRRKLHNFYEEELRGLRGDQVFTTVFRDLTEFPEAQSERQTVLKYAPRSNAAALIRQLGDEVTARIERTTFQKQNELQLKQELDQQRKAG